MNGEIGRFQIQVHVFDFNRTPACCSVIQWYDDWVYVLETMKLPKAGTDAFCDYILRFYPCFLYMVTGDYSGQTASSIFLEEFSNYSVIQTKLRLSDGMLKLKTNPRLAKNQTHVNNILQYYNVTIHATKARGLIFDMENVKKRPDGTVMKVNRDDSAQQADALDTFRYFCNTWLDRFVPPVVG